MREVFSQVRMFLPVGGCAGLNHLVQAEKAPSCSSYDSNTYLPPTTVQN